MKSFSTLTNELHNFSKHVDPKWQGKYLREITPSDISSIVHEGLKGKSQQTKKHLVCQIRSAFRLAIELGYADKDPTEHIRIKVEKFNRQLPTSSDLRRLVETAKDLKLPMYPLMHFLLLTGCRSGEAFALDWSAVDFEGEVIHIRRNWTRRGGFKNFTKNKSHRQVPINEELKELLNYLRPLTSQTEERFVLHSIREWTNGEIGKSLRLFMQGLGMTPTTLHGLRAAFITEMLKSGADIPTIMRIVGHKTLETCTRYVSLSGVELRDKTKKLSFLNRENESEHKAA
ncbi:MAG: site-specific integrase [Deltaproteobacteria bacterium]|nr:site-specific integrase [Deltaproteobacteria bacterium]